MISFRGYACCFVILCLMLFRPCMVSGQGSLPSAWVDSDIGNVSLPGSAGYGSNVFTVTGAGSTFFGDTADAFHFAYLPLSSDGSITARVTSTNASAHVGVMIRETLDAGSDHMLMDIYQGYAYEVWRSGGDGTSSSNSYVGWGTVPIWIRVVRSGNTFTDYTSPDGVNWNQAGTSQTITMGQNVYMGLAVAGNTSSTYTATFDNISFASTGYVPPSITGISATTGAIGSQVVISGSGFGESQQASLVLLPGMPATINSWNDSSISLTVPNGAGSGPLVVSVAPTMNDSNPIYFTVTNTPLPVGWLDLDIGLVGVGGSAGFANNVFTVQGGGSSLFGDNADAFHFAYVPLSGDGSITARVTGTNTSAYAGVMIRELLDPGSDHMFMNLRQGVSVRDRPSCEVSTNGLSGHFSMCGIEIPRQQVLDPVDGVVGDASHHIPQIGFGIQAVKFRRTDQAVDRRGTFSSGIRSCEQVVLPSQGHSAQRALRGVVIDLNVAIFYIACQRVPTRERVANRGRRVRLAREFR